MKTRAHLARLVAETLDGLRLVVGSAFLLYATIVDLQTRRVPNPTWIGMGTIAGLMALFDLFVGRTLGFVDIVIALGVTLLIYVLWYFHAIKGGADAKALMVLAFFLPGPIQWDFLGQTFPIYASPIPPALVVFVNSAVVITIIAVAIFLFNLFKGDWHFPNMFLGPKLRLRNAENWRVWVSQEVVDGQLVSRLFPSEWSEERMHRNLAALKQLGVKRVWTTPRFPQMLAFLVGYWAYFLLGDVVLHLTTEFVVSARN